MKLTFNMLKKVIMNIIFFNIFFFINSMELRELNPIINKEIVQAHSIVKKEISSDQLHPTIKNCFDNPCFKYYQELTHRVDNHENIMSKQQQLELLTGDSYFAQRKSIIISMINEDKIDPNVIRYQLNVNPFYESIFHQDTEFLIYLLDHPIEVQKKYQLCTKAVELFEVHGAKTAIML